MESNRKANHEERKAMREGREEFLIQWISLRPSRSPSRPLRSGF